MFERFTERARQSLLVARCHVEERNGEEIAIEDLLSGLLVAAPDRLLRFGSEAAETLRPALTFEQWTVRLWQDHSRGDTPARASREIPFSTSTKLALQRAAHEADDLRHRFIRPEHLLLGILRDEGTDEWRMLQKTGMTLSGVRAAMDSEPDVDGIYDGIV